MDDVVGLGEQVVRESQTCQEDGGRGAMRPATKLETLNEMYKPQQEKKGKVINNILNIKNSHICGQYLGENFILTSFCLRL